MYDLAIIGGGPAGVAAGVYASRKKLKTVFITDSFGGQSIVSDSIENWIGTPVLSGAQLAKDLETHLRTYAEDIVDIKDSERVETITQIKNGENAGDTKSGQVFSVVTNKASYDAKTILITTGSHRRKLDVPGADIFEHKGVTYCASCDGPMFSGKDLVVVGGGNAGFESAAQLLAYAKSVTLLHRSDSFRADPVTVEAVLKDPKMKAFTNATPTEVHGETFVDGISYKDAAGEIHKLDVEGIFVEIGALPTTGYAKDVVELDESNHVVIDPWNQRTSQLGIWAAGDCTNGIYHQNNIAAGDAVKALEDIYKYLKTEI